MTLNTLFDNGTHKIQTTGRPLNKSETERRWRDRELIRTDELVKIPDYPVDLTVYRQALRDYPQQPDFPNGDRPTI